MNGRGWRRWRTPVTIAIAVIVLAISAAFANVALLGSAGEDRLGRLRPVDPHLSTTAGATVAVPSQATTNDADGDHAEPRGGDGDDDD